MAAMTQDFRRYIVWGDHGSEGWGIFVTTDTFEQAKRQWESMLRMGTFGIITEYIKPYAHQEEMECPETKYLTG